MPDKNLNDLFLDTLKDIYYAEKQIYNRSEDGESRAVGPAPRRLRKAP